MQKAGNNSWRTSSAWERRKGGFEKKALGPTSSQQIKKTRPLAQQLRTIFSSKGTHLSLSCKNVIALQSQNYQEVFWLRISDLRYLRALSQFKAWKNQINPWKPPASTIGRAFPSCAFSVCTSISKALREMHFINLALREFRSLGEFCVAKLQSWVKFQCCLFMMLFFKNRKL